MIIYSEIDKYKGVHMNASHLAVTGTLSLVTHQTDNPNMTHMMLSTMYNIEAIHYNITVGALQLFVYLYYYYDKSLNFY